MKDFPIHTLHSVQYVDEGMVCLVECEAGWVPVLVTHAAGYYAYIWNGRRKIDRWENIRRLLKWDERIGVESEYRAALERGLEKAKQ